MGLIEIKETFDEELYKDSSAEGASGRDRIIIRTSVIGILANVLLAAFKAVVGLLTHSIAIVLDAVNIRYHHCRYETCGEAAGQKTPLRIRAD